MEWKQVLEIQEDKKEGSLFYGRELLIQLSLDGGGGSSPTGCKAVQEILQLNGFGQASVHNDIH